MSANLAKLLILLGLVGAGFGVWTALPGVTRAQLVAAGIQADCVPVLITCPVILPGNTYKHVRFQGARCPNPDGGRADFIVPPKIAASASIVDKQFCTIAANCVDAALCGAPGASGAFNDNGASTADDVPDCACVAADAGPGQCLKAGAAGAGDWWGWNNRIPPGQFSGTGCIPTLCVEVAGASAYPAACTH